MTSHLPPIAQKRKRYQKVIPLANIPLAGPASLMIDYRGSTDTEKSGKSE
jgi:hypothetical protein